MRSYRYLGGHVLEGAGECLCAGADAGQSLARTKVGYLHHAAVRVHQHVVTLRTPLQGFSCAGTYQQGWAKFVLIALERYSVELKRLTFNFR
jgi:hypothetical protein